MCDEYFQVETCFREIVRVKAFPKFLKLLVECLILMFRCSSLSTKILTKHVKLELYSMSKRQNADLFLHSIKTSSCILDVEFSGNVDKCKSRYYLIVSKPVSIVTWMGKI